MTREQFEHEGRSKDHALSSAATWSTIFIDVNQTMELCRISRSNEEVTEELGPENVLEVDT